MDTVAYGGDEHTERFAEQYDEWFGFAPPTADTVKLLHGLAGPEPVLELGIGTGRVALPLSARGVTVQGVEASREMAAHLRAKPGGEHIAVTIGDFGQVPFDGSFSLVYVATGTFFALLTQEAQIGCFVNAARRLAPGATFVLDAVLPEALSSPELGNGRVVPTANGDLVVLYRCVARAAQCYDSHYVITADAGVRHIQVPFRYAGAGELDLMARIAGLRLRQCYGSWAATPFTTAASTMCRYTSSRTERGELQCCSPVSVRSYCLVVLLVPFVILGARTDPHRPFSRGMSYTAAAGNRDFLPVPTLPALVVLVRSPAFLLACRTAAVLTAVAELTLGVGALGLIPAPLTVALAVPVHLAFTAISPRRIVPFSAAALGLLLLATTHPLIPPMW